MIVANCVMSVLKINACHCSYVPVWPWPLWCYPQWMHWCMKLKVIIKKGTYSRNLIWSHEQELLKTNWLSRNWVQKFSFLHRGKNILGPLFALQSSWRRIYFDILQRGFSILRLKLFTLRPTMVRCSAQKALVLSSSSFIISQDERIQKA